MSRRSSASFTKHAPQAALDHPNLCTIYEVGESEDGYLFLAMPLYPGESLKERLARDGPLPVQDAVAIARQIAEGLSAAHDGGIVHRDVKPGNVMLLPNGALKILDFGLAKIRDLSLTTRARGLRCPARPRHHPHRVRRAGTRVRLAGAARGGPRRADLSHRPNFDPVRSEPRFERVVQRLGLRR